MLSLGVSRLFQQFRRLFCDTVRYRLTEHWMSRTIRAQAARDRAEERVRDRWLTLLLRHQSAEGIGANVRGRVIRGARGAPGLAVLKRPRKPSGKRHGKAPFFDAVGDGLTEQAAPGADRAPGLGGPPRPLLGREGLTGRLSFPVHLVLKLSPATPARILPPARGSMAISRENQERQSRRCRGG